MSKSISQDTFNNVVKENMEIFDMTLDAAINEAQQQFEAQGVNLYNIITDKSIFKIEDGEIVIGVHPVISHLNNMKILLLEFNKNIEKVENDLNSLKEYFQSDLAYRLMGANNEGLCVLKSALEYSIESNNKEMIKNCLVVLGSFLNGQPDTVNKQFLEYLTCTIKSGVIGKHCISLIFRMFSYCCFKHEINRQTLIDQPNNIIPLSVNQLEVNGFNSKELTKEICSFLRTLLLDDDVRVAFGRGTENAKIIVTETSCLDILCKLCKEYKEKEDEVVVAELFYTLDKLSVRNEFCLRILELGGLDYIIEALENHINSQRIATSSFAVLKSLAANDRVKLEIGKENRLGLILRALEIHIHNKNSCVNGFGALSAVSLRILDNSRYLVRLGLPQLLKQALQIHIAKKHFDVLRPVCLTTRNVVARCPELKADILEAGLEELLNMVLKLGRECDDEAKAALRDLGCKVELKELWTGKIGVKVLQS